MDMPETITPQFTQTSVDVKLDYIQRDIRDIKESMKDSVGRREFNETIKTLRDEAPTKNLADHENRIRSLEQFKWQLIGGLVAFQALADYVLYLMLKK